MKFFKKFIAVVLAIIFIVWGLPMLKCEYLTARHGHEFLSIEDARLATDFKVLTYKDNFARIYYINFDGTSGYIHNYVKQDGKWIYNEWEDGGWSVYGTADDSVWPYFWHMSNYEKFRRFELNEDKSFFSSFYVKDDKVYIECDVVIDSLIDFDIEMCGSFKRDEGKLLKHPVIYAYDKETGSDKFHLVQGSNSFRVVFIGDYGGTPQKADRLLPYIYIYPYSN